MRNQENIESQFEYVISYFLCLPTTEDVSLLSSSLFLARQFVEELRQHV